MTFGNTLATALSLFVCAMPVQGGEIPDKFSVAVRGKQLIKNDGTGTRFFVSGMVFGYGTSHDLDRYKRPDVEEKIRTTSRYGGSALAWRAFLKGNQLTFGKNNLCTGMVEGAVDKIRHTLDTAYKQGIVIQVTLSTAHFLQYGWGGKTRANRERVRRNKQLYATDAGTKAYIRNVVKPIARGVGRHPGLFGYLIVNEAGGMIRKGDVEYGYWSDEFLSLREMQRFVNRVAGAIHDIQPGALVTTSAVTFSNVKYWYDAALRRAGGHAKGTLDHYQVQFYPRHRGDDKSPFHRPASHWKFDKPIVIGEFPSYGCRPAKGEKFQPSSELGIVECFNYLYDKKYDGGFTWTYSGYKGFDHTHTAAGLRAIYRRHPKNVTLSRPKYKPRP